MTTDPIPASPLVFVERKLAELGARLERIDERTLNMQQELAEIRREMVTKPEFTPVRAIAYGLAALILSGTVAAVLQLVLKSQ